MNVKIRLPDNTVVDAEYVSPCVAHKRAHMVRHEGKTYRAADFKPCEKYPFWCRFVGPGAVLRAM